jgi:hypothetical protein
MGVNDYHVSQEDMERKFVEQSRKETEERKAVFGLINEEGGK